MAENRDRIDFDLGLGAWEGSKTRTYRRSRGIVVMAG